MKKTCLILIILLVGGILTTGNPKQELTNMAGKQMATSYGGYVAGPSAQYVTNAPQTLGYAPLLNQDGTVQSGSTTDQNTLNQYDQSIGNTQSAIDRLGSQQNSGNSTIDASWQNALNQLLSGKNQANSTYTTNKQQSATDYVGAKNTIGANAGSSLSGLLRLLGSRGAGGSSAARISAPGAVARNATQQRTDVGNTFGANNQALDTNWANYLQGYDNQVSGAGSQRDQQKNDLQRTIDTNRATLLQFLASLSGQRAQAAGGSATGAAQPYLDQANQVLDKTANYTTAPINFQTQAYNAPSLGKYTTNPNAAPTVQGQGASNDYFSPYLAALLGKKQQYA